MSNILLCDLGGTHARFSTLEDGAIAPVQIYKVAGFGSFADVLMHHSVAIGAQFSGAILFIASAGSMNAEGNWVGASLPWKINVGSLAKEFGLADIKIINDFHATALALPSLQSDQVHVIQEGVSGLKEFCVAGCGTGLGLAHCYEDGAGQLQVRQTYGGHMAFSGGTDEQQDIIQRVKQVLRLGRTLVAEDVASGTGLSNLYAALSGVIPAPTGEEIVAKAKAGEGNAQTAIRLHTELLALFCHQAVLYAGVGGRLYLTGALLLSLHANNLLDLSVFKENFTQNPAEIVRQGLEEMHIALIQNETPALMGLWALHESPDGKKASAAA